MAASLILYGSRARGDERVGSDIDLIMADESPNVASPNLLAGVSLHRYPKQWLIEEAASGSLFAYHVAFEGLPLDDPDDFHTDLRSRFRKKESYREERRLAGLIMKMILERDWSANDEARRRYFWALRTMLITWTADVGRPVFSSVALEKAYRLPGLGTLLNGRADASFRDCLDFGRKVIASFAGDLEPSIQGEELRAALVAMGGIARDSVRIVEEREAIEIGGMPIYF